jgi:hypothetical protein
MKTLLGSACIGAALFGMQSTQAQVLLFGNPNNPGGTSASFTETSDPSAAYGGAMGSPESRGAGFTTGATTYTLDHIDLTLYEVSPGASARVQIFGGTAAGPSGAALATLSPNPLGVTGTATTYAFAGGGFTLSSGTTYWIAVANLNGAPGSLAWGMSDTIAGTAPTAANGSGYTSEGSFINFSSDNLASTDGLGNPEGFADPTASPNFAVYATAVPEPHQYALIAGLGLCSFAALRRRIAARA